MGGAVTSQGGIANLGGKGAGVTGASRSPTTAQTLDPQMLANRSALESMIAQRAGQQQFGNQLAQQFAPAAMYLDPSMVGALLNQRVSPDYAFAQQMKALQAPSYRETANYAVPETPARARATTTGLTASPLETLIKAVATRQSGPGPNGDR